MDDITAKYTVGQPSAPLAPSRKVSLQGRFIPAIPLRLLTYCVQNGLEDALPLVLAVHRQLSMRKVDWTPLNKFIWQAAGDPSEKKRTRILARLRKHPNLVGLRERKTSTSHYDLSYGEAWLSF